MPLSISSTFDSGNISVISAEQADDIRLAIRPDNASKFLQWFHFRLVGARSQPCTISIVNAGDTSYPGGWENYTVATSHDRQHWYRTPTLFNGRTLSWSITPEYDSLYFAYFAPYSLERHADLVAHSARAPGVTLEVLGQTLDGRDLDCLHIGPAQAPENTETDAERLQIWSIARQHPGESMAEWWMEGWLARLLDADDATSVALRRMADIHVVPNMNPDGSHRGHLRTNAEGINLNREWGKADMSRSPEVFLVQQCMHGTGIHLSLDVHGDEVLPYNFIAGTEGIPGWNSERDRQLVEFKHALASLNPDFQTTHGYPRARPGSANLTYCSNHVANAFGCLAVTLEMPFKDTVEAPRTDVGWSPERCRKLGSSCVEAVHLFLKTGDNLLVT